MRNTSTGNVSLPQVTLEVIETSKENDSSDDNSQPKNEEQEHE